MKGRAPRKEHLRKILNIYYRRGLTTLKYQVSSTIAYINLREKTPYEFCLIVGEKLNAQILRKERINRSLHEAVNKTLEEERGFSRAELESRNKYWDSFQKHMEALDGEDLFLHQKKNSLYYLEKYGVSVHEVKKYLHLLGYYKGDIDNEFTKELADSIKTFQILNNMRHVDGMIGEMTLKEIEERLNDETYKKMNCCLKRL